MSFINMTSNACRRLGDLGYTSLSQSYGQLFLFMSYSRTELIKLKPLFKGGRINFSIIDTEPGAASWAAPPIPVDDYTLWLRTQYKHHRDIPVYLAMAARMKFTKGLSIKAIGPHKNELLTAMQAIVNPHTGQE